MTPTRLRLVGLLVTLGFLGGDLWSKEWAKDTLASHVHPLFLVVSDAEAGRTLGELFAARGVSTGTLGDALGRGVVLRARLDTGLDPALPLAKPEAPGQIFALAGVGHPAPRAFFNSEGLRQSTLAAALASEWRMEVPGAEALVRGGLWVGAGRSGLSLDRRVEAGEGYALLDRSVELIPSLLKCVYAENPGAAWGFLASAGPTFRFAFFSLISLVASCVMAWMLFVRAGLSLASTIALGAILAGALGNLVDRVRYRVVIDFILMYVESYQWPVYNVADIGITVGVVFLLIEILFASRKAGDTPAPARRKAT